MYLTQWPPVFLLKDAVKKASTDLPAGNGSRHSVGSAGVWVSVQGHRLRAPIGFGFGTLSAFLQVRLGFMSFEATSSSVINEDAFN